MQDKLMLLYPQLTTHDFMLHIIVQNDGNGDYIAKWEHSLPKPTDEQLA